MDLAGRTWRRSMGAVFVTVLLQGVIGYEVDVQSSECIHQLVDSDSDLVSGSFVVVSQRIEATSEYDDIEMQVLSPSGEGILRMKAKGGQKFQFNTPKEGYYKICFVNMKPGNPKTVDFALRVGQSLHPQDLAKNDHFDPVQVKIGQLREALERVSLEQKYYTARDLRHRQTNESTYSRLFWYTSLEYVCLIAVSLAQVYLVQSLFSKRIGYNSV